MKQKFKSCLLRRPNKVAKFSPGCTSERCGDWKKRYLRMLRENIWKQKWWYYTEWQWNKFVKVPNFNNNNSLNCAKVFEKGKKCFFKDLKKKEDTWGTLCSCVTIMLEHKRWKFSNIKALYKCFRSWGTTTTITATRRGTSFLLTDLAPTAQVDFWIDVSSQSVGPLAHYLIALAQWCIQFIRNNKITFLYIISYISSSCLKICILYKMIKYYSKLYWNSVLLQIKTQSISCNKD